MNATGAVMWILTLSLCVGKAAEVGRQLGITGAPAGAVYRLSTNGTYYPATNISEMWPGVWKEDTNGLRVQLHFVPARNTPRPFVSVCVGSVVKNSMADYAKAPSGKFAKCELRDSDGNIVKTAKGISLEAQFPVRIPARDLPRNANGRRRTDNVVGFVTNGPPDEINRIAINESYRIEKEGDYTLTVRPVIYRFGTNNAYLDLVELPTVSTNIHLVPFTE